MSDEAFEKWLVRFAGKDGFSATTTILLKAAWAESRHQALAELSEPLPCGHPSRCAVEVGTWVGPSQGGQDAPQPVCLACSAAREAAERAAEGTRSAVKQLGRPEDGCGLEVVNVSDTDTLDLAPIIERAVRRER